MYAFTPESFPGPRTEELARARQPRCCALVGWRPALVSAYTGFTTAPIYASAALWIAVGILCFALPFKIHGHAAI